MAPYEPLKLLLANAQPLPIHIFDQHHRTQNDSHGLPQHRTHRLLHMECIDKSHDGGEVGDFTFEYEELH